MPELAAAAAVETDRLVLGVNRARDPEVIARRADGLGLDGDWHLLGHWWDFLLAGTLTRSVARLRTRYWPETDVDATLERLLAEGLVHEVRGALVATDRVTPLLHAIRDESARAARGAWSDQTELVTIVAAGARRMTEAAGDDAPVVVAHRAIGLPEDEHLGVYCRLVTVRYIRQHDHAGAWSTRDLTAGQMRVYTALWQGEAGPDDAPAREALRARGLVATDGTLTAAGRDLRDRIEADTLDRSARTYQALGAGASNYLAALRGLPTPR